MAHTRQPSAKLFRLYKVFGLYFWLQALGLATEFVGITQGSSLFAQNIRQTSAQPPQRIASLSLASDEILIDLMPLCGGIGRIVALSTFVDNPTVSSVAHQAVSIKGRVHSEPESLFALKPDLVIGASFNRPELLQMVKARKVTLLTLKKFDSAEDIAEHITEIGKITSCETPAAALKAKFLQKLSTAKSKSSHSTDPARVILYSDDMVVMGQDTLFDDLVRRAGAINVVSEKGLKRWPKIDTDTLLALRPTKIVILGDDSKHLREQIRNHAAWGRLAAVKNNQFIFLNSRTAQSTSHYFADAVQDLRLNLVPVD